MPITAMATRSALWWIAANTLAWTIAVGSLTIQDYGGAISGACTLIGGGVLIGTGQWLALRRPLCLSPIWIAGTGFAWTAGIWAGLATIFVTEHWGGVTGGTLAGFVQAWILRQRVARSWLWAPVTVAGSTLGWLIGTHVGVRLFMSTYDLAKYFAARAAAGFVIGAVSAPLLWVMLRHPKARQEAL